MHSKSKRALFLPVLFFEAGDGLEKAKANHLMYLLPEQTACKINKTWTKEKDKNRKTFSLLSIMFRHSQDDRTEKQLPQILFMETYLHVNDKITSTFQEILRWKHLIVSLSNHLIHFPMQNTWRRE